MFSRFRSFRIYSGMFPKLVPEFSLANLLFSPRLLSRPSPLLPATPARAPTPSKPQLDLLNPSLIQPLLLGLSVSHLTLLSQPLSPPGDGSSSPQAAAAPASPQPPGHRRPPHPGLQPVPRRVGAVAWRPAREAPRSTGAGAWRRLATPSSPPSLFVVLR